MSIIDDIIFVVMGKEVPPLTDGAFYLSPPANRVEILVNIVERAKILKPGEMLIPLKPHIAHFRRTSVGPNEFAYQLLSKPPEGWTWVIHNGTMRAHRTSTLRK